MAKFTAQDRQGRKTDSTEFRHRVAIQTRGLTGSGLTGFAETYTTARTVWASVNPIKAAQQFDYRSVGVDATHVIKINGRTTINEKTDRLLYGTRTFEILTVENIQERGIVKIVTCKELR
jgi:SPP1 family predicted phage head-tail adaptor